MPPLDFLLPTFQGNGGPGRRRSQHAVGTTIEKRNSGKPILRQVFIVWNIVVVVVVVVVVNVAVAITVFGD
ncbi:unnamed protein product [Alternaria alternata]